VVGWLARTSEGGCFPNGCRLPHGPTRSLTFCRAPPKTFPSLPTFNTTETDQNITNPNRDSSSESTRGFSSFPKSPVHIWMLWKVANLPCHGIFCHLIVDVRYPGSGSDVMSLMRTGPRLWFILFRQVATWHLSAAKLSAERHPPGTGNFVTVHSSIRAVRNLTTSINRLVFCPGGVIFESA
jgi:hypothetical protein